MKLRTVLSGLVILGFLSACNLPRTAPTPNAGLVASLVAATLQEMATPVHSPLPSVIPTLPPTTSTSMATLTPIPGMTMTPIPEMTMTPVPGSIEGGISGYPYGSIPALTVVAFDQSSPYLKYWYWKTAPGNTSYAMEGYVSPGSYQVVAYDGSGHAGGCAPLVTVVSNQKATCDITDWAGSYPADPVH